MYLLPPKVSSYPFVLLLLLLLLLLSLLLLDECLT